MLDSKRHPITLPGAAGAKRELNDTRFEPIRRLDAMTTSWLGRVVGGDRREGWSEHARESILDANDGIVTAAGVAEGFAKAGASTGTLLLAGAVVIVAGGLAAAGARYSEERTEWEMDRGLLEAERASIEADPRAELDELVRIYETKGLSPDLARQVAEALMQHDPVAAHADAELRLDSAASPMTSLHAGLTAGLCYALGAAVPLAVVSVSPVGARIELTVAAVLLALALTGWFTSWLTGLSPLRLVRRNLILGTATLAAGFVVGLLSGIHF
jgi:vacuolar iron transporter family protein